MKGLLEKLAGLDPGSCQVIPSNSSWSIYLYIGGGVATLALLFTGYVLTSLAQGYLDALSGRGDD